MKDRSALGCWSKVDAPAVPDPSPSNQVGQVLAVLSGKGVTPEVGRNPNESVRQVKAFQHVAETGEVTPSGWEPGDVTLTPGPDLVGKVWEAWKVE